MHLVCDAETFLRYGEVRDLAVQMGVVDGDGRVHGESLQCLFIAGSEFFAIVFFAEIEVSEERSFACDRNGEKRMHDRVIRRKSVRTRVAANVRESQMLAFTQHDSEEAMPDGRRTDAGALFGSDARRNE